ncbi:MAG: hypothetical protein LQ341_000600 [Variospora aurantia]|nr:MAG: hypothetical protein LQ341_000600 [Variospora aurantia]
MAWLLATMLQCFKVYKKSRRELNTDHNLRKILAGEAVALFKEARGFRVQTYVQCTYPHWRQRLHADLFEQIVCEKPSSAPSTESQLPAQRQIWPSEVIPRLTPMNSLDTIPNTTFASQESRGNACARVSPGQYSRYARGLYNKAMPWYLLRELTATQNTWAPGPLAHVIGVLEKASREEGGGGGRHLEVVQGSMGPLAHVNGVLAKAVRQAQCEMILEKREEAEWVKELLKYPARPRHHTFLLPITPPRPDGGRLPIVLVVPEGGKDNRGPTLIVCL